MAGFVFYSFLYFTLIYYPGLVRMDDFGYLQGVIETLAQGRPQTHAWLEPYTATTSSLSALAYLITGNFPLSTWGLQSLFVLANVVILYRLFRFRMEVGTSTFLALAVATLPVYWHKCSEFGGMAMTVTMVLLALWAYLRGRWAWFFVAVFLAFANRQNCIALLALPAYHFIWYKVRDPGSRLPSGPENGSRWSLAIGACAFSIAALLLHSRMNHTVAQAYGIYAGMDPGKVSAILHTQLFGIFSGLAFLSGFGLLMGERPGKNLLANLRKPITPVALTLVFWLLPVFWGFPLISFLTPLIGSVDRSFFLQKILLGLIPALIWALDFKLIRFDGPFCLFAAYTFLSGLRGYWYDFYLMDVALAALFYRLTRESPFAISSWAKAVTVALIAGNIIWAYGYKILSDKQMLSVSVYEGLERAGKVPIEEMTDATFGYLGWKLFDHYWHHERITYLANFMCYGRRDRVIIESELPWRRRFKSTEAQGTLVEEGKTSVGFFKLRYRVVDRHGTADVPFCESEPLVLDRTDFRIKPYPLNAGEWSSLIEARSQAVGIGGQ